MSKNELLKLVNSLPDNANIDISVDVSTSEDNASDRAFATKVLRVQHIYKDRYSILASGTKNF